MADKPQQHFARYSRICMYINTAQHGNRQKACHVDTAGSMYPFFLAVGTVAVVSTAGACLNYELSARLVRDLVVDLMPGKLRYLDVICFVIPIARLCMHLRSLLSPA